MTASFEPRLRQLLDRYESGDADAANLLCDRHPADAVAFTVVESDLSSRDLTYGYLRQESARFAAALAGLGVEPGDAVAVLMGKSAELVIALLGIWRRGAVHVPLFTAFATPAITQRVQASGARLIIADAEQAGKLAAGADLPGEPSWQVIIANGEPGPGQRSFTELIDAHRADEPAAASVAVGGAGTLVLLYTSGTTGTPKGVKVPLRALASFQAYLEFGLDVDENDVFWNAADPGWAYGLYYAILGPLAAGVRSLLLHAGFSPALTWQVIHQFGVSNFAAAPTVYRALRSEPAPAGIRLRRASSAGEPLTPEVIDWALQHLGIPVRDHYGQTEHGMVIVNGWADPVRAEVRPGSMGRPLPGWSAAVLDDTGSHPLAPGQVGQVAIRVAESPLLWFTGYNDDPARTAERFSADGAYYLTGDVAAIDAEGYFFFSSRDDDVIIMAGYRIGPFDVESVLAGHPRVVEAAVIGVPDSLRGEVLEAFVVLASGDTGDEALVTELQQLVKQKFAAHAYPRTVHFVAELPKTTSGKVQRFVLRQRRRDELSSAATATS
ncbi:AMP-binding protein [Nocardia rhamnosiphila]